MIIRYLRANMLFWLLVFSHLCIAQTKRDSLLNLRPTTETVNLPRLMAEIASSYFREDLGMMKVFLDSALLVADTSTPLNDLIRVNYYYADYYDRMANYDSAVYYYQEAAESATATDDDVWRAKAISSIGLIYYKSARYDLSSEYLLEAVRIAEETGHRETVSVCYGYLGHLNYSQKKFDEAISYQKMGKEINIEDGDLRRAATADVNIGNAFHQLELLDSSLYYLQSALDYFVSTNDTLSQSYPLNNMAMVYNQQDEYEKSIILLERGLAIRTKYNEPRGICFGLNYLGLNYREMGQFEKAIDYYERSVAQAIPIDYVLLMENSYEGLAECHASLNQFEQAYDYQKKLNVIADTLFNQDKLQSLADAQTKYETEKKEKEIELLNTQNKLQATIIRQDNLYLIGAAGLIVFILALGGLLFRQRDLKNKALVEQERTVQKSEQIRAVISSQEEERKRFAMDLHDDFGQMLSALRIQSNQAVKVSTTRDQINGQLDQMYRSLKVIAFNLMPQTLDKRGLSDAVAELCLQLNNMGKIRFSYHEYDAEDHLDNQQKVAIYRVIQEVVNNIIKYANAQHVTINITGYEDSMSVMIEDDGDGFDLEYFKSGKGNGWRNIESRIDLLAGDIDFDTQLGRKHTTVNIHVPFIMQQMQVA
ncbi:MAG: tetratricopeptide repeat protein [Cyclobacteriaceae bacterium]